MNICEPFVLQGHLELKKRTERDLRYSPEKKRINISIWATAHLPLPKPNINSNLLSIDCCWVTGGVGGQLLRY